LSPLSFLNDEINSLVAASRLRTRHRAPGTGVVVACSNDYLGYGSEIEDGEALGATGSRLVVGDADEQLSLEAEVAGWTGQPAALLFSSGFAANLGVLQALAGPGDLVVSLALNHASIIDGCRLSGASVAVVPTEDVSAAERALRGAARRKFLVTESYFSMDGLTADLVGLRRACDAEGAALLVDEAHALGVFGPSGGGCCEQQGVRADLVVGTFGKALGWQGAFAASSESAVLWLWNRARSFVYSTGISPWLCTRIQRNVCRARADGAGRARLHENSALLRSLLHAWRVPVVPGSVGPIVAVLVGASARAVQSQEQLLNKGFFVRAIRPPTVPEGTARLRVTVSAGMTTETVTRLAEALRDSL
jgi:8-amino-7-oxononanoate synthase